MSTQIKLIIPLLNEDITKDDFTKEVGFVNAYIYNKNTPSLLNHLFLLYDSENRDYKKAKTIEKLNKLKSLYSRRCIRINGHFYILYTLSLIGKKMKDLLKGIPSFEESDITKTLSFWDLKEDDVNRILLGINPLLRTDNTSVPEEDYLIPDITTTSGYKESLAIRNDGLAFIFTEYIIEVIKTTFYLLSKRTLFLSFRFFLFVLFVNSFFLWYCYSISTKISHVTNSIYKTCSS